MGAETNSKTIYVEIPEGMRLFLIFWRRQSDNIKMEHEGVDWIGSEQETTAVINHRVP